jgi:hypothetical protein
MPSPSPEYNSETLSTEPVCTVKGSRVTSQRLTQTKSHIMTEGHSSSQAWCQAPSGAKDQIFITVKQLRFCRCGSSSLTRGSFSAVIVNSTCHLYLQFYISAFYMVSLQFYMQLNIYVCTIYTRPLSV